MTTLANPDDSVKEQTPSVLLCAVMDHLTCYLRTRRPRSAQIAQLLVDRLVADPAADSGLTLRCAQLCEAILETHMPATSPGRSAGL